MRMESIIRMWGTTPFPPRGRNRAQQHLPPPFVRHDDLRGEGHQGGHVIDFTASAGHCFEAAFTSTPKVVGIPGKRHSEGIDYRADGRGFLTSGEGANARIMQGGCGP
jgi:hypothetical protein